MGEGVRQRKSKRKGGDQGDAGKSAVSGTEKGELPEGFTLRAPQIRVNANDDGEPPLCIRVVLTLILFTCIVIFLYLQHFSHEFAGSVPALHAGVPWGFAAENVPNLTGKTYVVTGTSTGIGAATAKILYARNASVVMGCRDKAKCLENMQEIRANLPDRVTPQVLHLDLSSIASVREFAHEVTGSVDHLDGLVLNAGMLPKAFHLTPDGLEESFMVNYLGHFELTRLLMDSLLRTNGTATVVALSCPAHFWPLRTAAGVPLSLKEVNNEQEFDTLRTYGMTKLAGVLFVKELDRRYYKKGIMATAVNPGFVDTPLLAKAFQDDHSLQTSYEAVFRLMELVQEHISWYPFTASLSVVAAATRPTSHGGYTNPIAREFTPSILASNMETAERLWNFSRDLVESLGK